MILSPVAAVKDFRSHASCSMSKTSLFIPNRLKPWIDARQRFRLSHAHVQMAFDPTSAPLLKTSLFINALSDAK
jgi:hypothetical protein